MKKGLILEGGAMRGLFTAGVMDVLMEHRIAFDGAIGVSAGAAFGCNYKSGQIGRVLRYNTRFCRDPRYCGFRVLLKTGNIYSTDFCYGEVPLVHDIFDFDAYEQNPMEFYVVCTDIETGKAVYHKYEGRHDHGFDWIRASASMPVVSQVVEIAGMKLLDGGIADSIPVRYFESIGYSRNIAVLTQPADYIKKKNSLLPLIRRKYKAYPKLIEAMANRHYIYNETLEYVTAQALAGQLYVIRPEEDLPVSRVERDPKQLQRAYAVGRETAEKHIDRIRQFLA
ncbi:MAG: patatin family protein [Clostridia bacterium]|nr:patatin family protein [Clostridia bacterium]